MGEVVAIQAPKSRATIDFIADNDVLRVLGQCVYQNIGVCGDNQLGSPRRLY